MVEEGHRYLLSIYYVLGTLWAFVCISSVTPPDTSGRGDTMLSILQVGKHRLRKVKPLIKLQSGNDEAGIQTQICLPPKPVLFLFLLQPPVEKWA